MEGTITKGIGGFYYVSVEERTFQCKARGVFRKDGLTPFIGDRVVIDIIDGEEAIIVKVLPRKNLFLRPPVTNVDCLLITASIRRPDLNLHTIDKFLVMAEYRHVDIGICLNKIDIASGEEIDAFRGIYDKIYPVICVSGKTGEGIDLLKSFLAGKKSAFAGSSGVGKSTLLNWLIEGEKAEIGEISERSQRGKHTTRHVELFELVGGGMIFDTPGFTSFEILEAEEQELELLYPEMSDYIGSCRYKNCRHINEPGCSIRSAVEKGHISISRYESYSRQIKEIQEMRRY